MSDGIKVLIGDDGVARMYDDTYDITIHCESKQEQDEVVKKLQSLHWIPVTIDLPPESKYVLCTTMTKKGLRQVVKGYYSDGRWCCGMNSNVVAWKPLPDPWEGEADE